MALYISPKEMIADERLDAAQRYELTERYMQKVEHKSQLIADLNFVRTVAKKKAAFYWDVNTMVSHRAPDLSDNLTAATLSDAQLKYEDALKHVRGLTDKINTVTKELNAVVKEMHGLYTTCLAIQKKKAAEVKAKTKKAAPKAKTGKPAIRQNTIHMNRHELTKFINGLVAALRQNPNEDDFNINLITAVRGN
jgi:ABC-type uncharacterized transport system fused permease/ATPase subunit